MKRSGVATSFSLRKMKIICLRKIDSRIICLLELKISAE